MASAKETLRHSIAFRVTENEWRILQSTAKKQKISVPQLAKALLFERVGFEIPQRTRNSYGQKSSTK
jgi:predicted HicB family RNase H-like nuclease